MNSFPITLLEKKQLTDDVYELIYHSDDKLSCIPGQFLLCETDDSKPALRRSYSISDYNWDLIHFIIKRLPKGKGGSKAICDQTIGHTMQVWWPLGHFILPQKIQRICFIGTGTWFAPLYFQAKTLLESHQNIPVIFIFGVRKQEDLFYQDILKKWSETYPHFSYHYCLSWQKDTPHFSWRVTDYILKNPDLFEKEDILSVCGNPHMVQEVQSILLWYGIQKEKILYEQY